MSQSVCPLCHQELVCRLDQVVDPQTGDVFRILVCNDCGLGITDPLPENLDRYYAEGYHGGRHGITATMCDARRVAIVGQLLSSSAARRLLDVGCGDGTFAKAMSHAGWQATGVEKYAKNEGAQGIRIVESLDQAAASAPFDCITLWHVLEHLTDLGGTLETLRSLLAPQGVLVIAVPDFGSFQARLFGASWLHLDVPRHITHWTRPSLEQLLKQHGFTYVQRRRSELEYDLMGWAQSTLNALGAEPNVFMKRLTGRPTQTRGWKLAAPMLIGFCLCLIGMVPVWLSGCFGKAGTLIIAARLAVPPTKRQK